MIAARHDLAAALGLATLCAPVAVQAATTVSCEAGCRPVTACAGNASPYLLCLLDRESDLKLGWSVDATLAEGESLHVYAGNPARGASIPERAVSFAADGARQAGAFTFTNADLGTGPLLVVTTLKKGGSEKLLSWIPFRTSTPAETGSLLAGADPAGNWSVDVIPSFVQVSAGWRELPRTRDTRTRTWLSLATDSMLASDADLDGTVSGVPGLVMQVSAPWPAREDWKNKVQQLLGVPENHAVKFESLHWEEKPDRTIEGIPGVGTVSLRNYYTVVTLFTNASVATYTAKDMGQSGSSRYFAHETSANLKQVDNPLLWASYSLNDYGADTHLLDLMRRHVESNAPSLELGQVQRINGDGGVPTYRAAFTLRVRPWADDSTRDIANPHAGVVAVDVLAVRAGLGGIKVPASNATGVAKDSLCGIWSCADDGLASIDFNKPPKGWEVSPPQASTLTVSGQIPLLDGIKSIAERSPDAVAGNQLPVFPAQAQFALGASLRAGALVRRGGFFGSRVDGVVPINSYAQYVLRFTVATFPGQQLASTDTAVVASPGEIALATVTPPRRTLGDRLKDWIREHFALSGFILLIMVAALVLLVPGFRQALSAFFGLIAAILRRLTGAVSGKKDV